MENQERRRAARAADAAGALIEDWLQRCAARLTELDPELGEADARALALDMQGFERTGAMDPVEAADFVSAEMRRSPHNRFERRARDAGDSEHDRAHAEPPEQDPA